MHPVLVEVAGRAQRARIFTVDNYRRDRGAILAVMPHVAVLQDGWHIEHRYIDVVPSSSPYLGAFHRELSRAIYGDWVDGQPRARLAEGPVLEQNVAEVLEKFGKVFPTDVAARLREVHATQKEIWLQGVAEPADLAEHTVTDR